MQGPRVVKDGEAGICRLAWLPTDDVLLRVEASVLALEPMLLEDESLVGFHPPSLGSLRCDVMQKLGELENASILDGEKDVVMPQEDSAQDEDGDSGLDAIRDSLRL